MDELEEGLLRCLFRGGGVELSDGTSGAVLEAALRRKIHELTEATEALRVFRLQGIFSSFDDLATHASVHVHRITHVRYSI